MGEKVRTTDNTNIKKHIAEILAAIKVTSVSQTPAFLDYFIIPKP